MRKVLKKITIKNNNHPMVTNVNYRGKKKCFAQLILNIWNILREINYKSCDYIL